MLKLEAKRILAEWSTASFLSNKTPGEIIYLTGRNFTVHGASGTRGERNMQYDYDKNYLHINNVIFPKNYLTGIGYTSDRDRNQIANFTYLDYNTNIDISDYPPADYVERYRQKLGEDGYKKTCAENALPVDFEKMSYPDFLEQRRQLMAGIVKQAYQKLCE